MSLQPGQILADKYRIVRPIGQGGMGAVFEGENLRIHRRVAIKTLHAQVAGKSDILQRFEREAQAAGRIGSDHIVEVLDMGDLPDGTRFMVMEFLDGTTLGDRIVKQGRIAPRDVVAPLTQLLDGLGAAHNAGIIHRDLKPANVFLLANRAGRPDFVKILDFGVSKFNVLNSDEMSMTRTGAVMGTPYYMSPEQAKGTRAVDPRSDLYSVGVILYESITGQVPFNAETFNELIFKIALESPPPPEHFVPNLDPQFGALLRRAMAREPNERFQSAQEMKEALLAWARDFDARVASGAPARTQMLPAVGGHAAQGPPPGGYAAGATVHAPLAAQIPLPVAAQRPDWQADPAQFGALPAAAPPKKSSAPLIVALGLALVAGAAAAWFFYGRTNVAEAGPKPSDNSQATATATAVVTAEAAKSTAPTADDPSSAPAPSSATPVDALPSAEPTTKPSTQPTAVATVPRTAPRPTVTAPPTATSKPTATATSTKGRDIRPDL